MMYFILYRINALYGRVLYLGLDSLWTDLQSPIYDDNSSNFFQGWGMLFIDFLGWRKRT